MRLSPGRDKSIMFRRNSAVLGHRAVRHCVFLVWALVASLGAAADPDRLHAQALKVPYAAQSATYAPLWIAQDAGLFKKQGLTVEIIYIPAGSVIVPALLSGEVAIANMSAAPAIAAWARGADLVLVAVGSHRLLHGVMTSPRFKKPEDLKERKIGSDRYGSLSDLALREALRHFKLVPDKDVAILQIGGLPERLAALKAGNIDGAMLTGDSKFQAERMGFHAVVDLTQLPIYYPSSSVIVRKHYLQTNREGVKKFLKGWVEGIKILKTDKNLSLSVLGKYLKTADRSLLDQVYETYRTVNERIPYADSKAIGFAIERLIPKPSEGKKVHADDFIDNSLLQELEKEGFIRELYAATSIR